MSKNKAKTAENADHAKGIKEKNGCETTQAVLDMAFESLTGVSRFSRARPTRQTNGRETPVVDLESKEKSDSRRKHPEIGLVKTAQEGAEHDSTFDAGRTLKTGSPPSPDELKTAIKARLWRKPSRPLWALTQVEAHLHERSAALAKLSSPEKKQPDRDLLIYQLTGTIDTSLFPRVMAPRLRGDVVALYSALQSSDPIDSILDRLTVAMVNSVMASHARATRTANLKAIDVNLRHAEKGTRAVIDLVEARTCRRGPQKVMVGNVNVKAGGQAIVGNVETSKNRSKSKTRGDSSLDTDDSPGKDEETNN